MRLFRGRAANRSDTANAFLAISQRSRHGGWTAATGDNLFPTSVADVRFRQHEAALTTACCPPMFETAKLVCEAICLVAVTFVFFWHPSIRNLVAAHRHALLPWAVVAFFSMHAVAQFTTRDQYRFPQPREPFPFTRWAMFAGTPHDIPEAGIYEWQARLADGTAVSLNPARLFVTPNVTIHFTKTHAIGDGLMSSDAATRREFLAHAGAYARGLAKRFEALSGTSPIISVELWKRRFPVRIGAHVPEPFIASDGCSVVYTTPIGHP